MSGPRIISRLSKFEPKNLLRVLGPDWVSALRAASQKDGPGFDPNDSAQLAKIIWAVIGEGILGNQHARYLFLSELTDEQLKAISIDLIKKASSSRTDDLLRLSNLKWSRSSKIAEVFLNDLGFTSDFLPAEQAARSAHELIMPNVKLHDLHDYQEELVERIAHRYLVERKNFLMHLPTGAGKTRVMMEALTRHHCEFGSFPLGKGVLWLAHSRELLEQAIETFRDVWALNASTPAAITRFYSSFDTHIGDFQDALVFASLQKIGRLAESNPSRLLKLSENIGTIIVDEAHKVGAPTYLKAARMLTSGNKNLLVGVTATPGRGAEQESENYLLASTFDGNLLTASLGDRPVIALQEKGVLAKLERIEIDSGMTIVEPSSNDVEQMDVDYSAKALKEVGNNSSRNNQIVNAIISEVLEGHSTLVFACSVIHARVLCAALAMSGVRAAYLDSSTPDYLRSEVIRSYRSGETKVLVNYEILTTGFDAPITKAVLIARPTKSIILYSQMIGRGLRGPKVGGNESCRIIDVVDNEGSFGNLSHIYSFFDDYWSDVKD